jgi:hypothetical protein
MTRRPAVSGVLAALSLASAAPAAPRCGGEGSCLADSAESPSQAPDLIAQAVQASSGAEEVVFAVRGLYEDGHYYGNSTANPWVLMIDAKPIPGGAQVVAVFSPHHGNREHEGNIVVVDSQTGPDQPLRARRISPKIALANGWKGGMDGFRDPYPANPRRRAGRSRWLGLYRSPRTAEPLPDGVG